MNGEEKRGGGRLEAVLQMGQDQWESPLPCECPTGFARIWGCENVEVGIVDFSSMWVIREFQNVKPRRIIDLSSNWKHSPE